MLETSKDLLFVVLAFCILWLTIFICWMIYYLAMLLKQVYDVAKGIRNKVEKLEDFVDLLKSKLGKSFLHFPIIAEGLSQLLKLLIERQGKKTSKRKK